MLEQVMLFLLFFMFGGGKQRPVLEPGGGGETPAERARREAEEARRRAEQATRSEQAQHRAQQLPPAWPVSIPTGLPPFPSGWEYANPVPAAVKARAWQLLDSLWAKGQGATATEMTGGEWIIYRAEITAGNKHGVVAYRTKYPIAPSLSPAKPPARASAPSLPSPAPAAAPSPAPAHPTLVTSPGLPQPHPAALPAGPAFPTAAPSTRPLLHQGSGMGALASQANWVKDLQFRLHLMPVDGKFGANTREAVLGFQRKQGLKPDGIVGPLTWSALDKASPASPASAWNLNLGPIAFLPSPAPA